jgi:hypothetical protein
MKYSVVERILAFLNPGQLRTRKYQVIAQQWDQFESGARRMELRS